ncbi:MAG: NAD-dependent epimerase [Mesorhizobium sp.]|uniref:NAD-dependent epimerase n=1 Tax=unclassified Mesorhizobium TaxID=325217 RepID=UPI000FCC6ABC|nr:MULTISPECIES: NAD-dependent epimerase [unclassified Mesorhizobium]RUV68770.1 NAD-dependent epimerase [Mesorhizobium sp. M5C.F.Cr.IN.023.01.1.1]RWF87362.1 MAG: NAD-dependent epimerase [Mesorhizobium sp.]RWF91709.1 MAG: NAD-dependent epimerase [Mesorhizobium sp.]RWI33757.1 MAG: NAD-dependent epimerase [Mesorhizobium sp.]RWI44774.1 MAG: NAD-dependent epimerase [Mesorhizobium sp.]
MSFSVIVGASSVGTATANLLASRGQQVKLVTRRGTGPVHPLIERVAADATDPEWLTAVSQGASAIYCCASPTYDRWPTDWPPLFEAIMIAAERTGAVLASYSMLYGYGPVKGVVSEDTPLVATHPKLGVRADLWREALGRHQAGRLKLTEIRSSDHIQPNSLFALALAKPLLEGKRVISPVPIDVPRSWTSVNDSAKLLVTVAQDPQAWGKAWHVPTNAPMTARQLLDRLAQLNGLPAPKVIVLPYAGLWVSGLFMPMLKELRTTYYRFDRPFLIDSRRAAETFGLVPEPIDAALRESAQMLRASS